MQKPGRGPLANKKVEALTNGTPLRQEKSRFERAKEIANKKSIKAGSPSTYTGSFSGGGGRRTGGTDRDIGSYVYNFAKEMISPSEPEKSKPKLSAEETKGSGFGGRGY